MLIGKTGNNLFSFFIHIFANNNYFLDNFCREAN